MTSARRQALHPLSLTHEHPHRGDCLCVVQEPYVPCRERRAGGREGKQVHQTKLHDWKLLVGRWTFTSETAVSIQLSAVSIQRSAISSIKPSYILAANAAKSRRAQIRVCYLSKISSTWRPWRFLFILVSSGAKPPMNMDCSFHRGGAENAEQRGDC